MQVRLCSFGCCLNNLTINIPIVSLACVLDLAFARAWSQVCVQDHMCFGARLRAFEAKCVYVSVINMRRSRPLVEASPGDYGENFGGSQPKPSDPVNLGGSQVDPLFFST